MPNRHVIILTYPNDHNYYLLLLKFSDYIYVCSCVYHMNIQLFEVIMTVCLWLKNDVTYWTRCWCRIRTLKPEEQWWRVSGDWCTLSKWDGASSFLLSLLKIQTMYPQGSPQSQHIMNLNLNKNLSQNESRSFCKWMNWNTCSSWNITNGLFFIADFDIKMWFLNFVIYMEVFYAWFELRFTCIKHVLVHVTLCNYRYIFVLAHTLVPKF